MADQLLTAAMEDRMTWKPISSAPRDGTPVLVVHTKRDPKVEFATYDLSTASWYTCFGSRLLRFAYAWQPIPEPPKETDDGH